ncbi:MULTISPECIES: hypothetical protein [unclassified Bradyrhizobium]|uniref:hypothetical protein n=1 Tax=unclassified Bradyrhizobium TaxID=2631580 RepID=UPI002916503C|nr:MULTISPECIES: hypothetical protein [unclassified Bradyrhizobium]
MPAAKPQCPPQPPAPLSADEVIFIKDTIKRFYGDDAIVRNFGPDPARMELHVETGRDIGIAHYDCCGVLMTRIDRDQIALEVSRRRMRIKGRAKLAYRYGVAL